MGVSTGQKVSARNRSVRAGGVIRPLVAAGSGVWPVSMAASRVTVWEYIVWGYPPGRQISTRNSGVRLVAGWSGSREQSSNLVLFFCYSLLCYAVFLALMSHGFRLIPCCFLRKLVKNGEEGRLGNCYVCKKSATLRTLRSSTPQKDPFTFSERLPACLCQGMLRRCRAFGFSAVSVGKLVGGHAPALPGGGQMAESLLVSVVGCQPFNVMFRTARLEAGGGR